MLRRPLASLLLLLAPPIAAAEAPAPPLATLGSLIARLASDGRIAILDVASGESVVWSPPAPGVRALAFRSPAAPGKVREIVVAAPAASGGSSTIFALDATSGGITAQATVSLDVSLLCPAPGARWVHLVGRRGDRWAVASLDLGAQTMEGPIVVPGPIRAAALSEDASRLFLAADDAVRTFVLTPLRSSWLLRSPGSNRDIVAIPAGRGMLVARASELAIFNPARLPARDPRTGAFPTDDAVATLALPFEPAAIEVDGGGRLAAALTVDGRDLAVADIGEMRILEVRAIPSSAAATFLNEPDRLLLVSPDASSVVTLPIQIPSVRIAAPPAGAAAPPPDETRREVAAPPPTPSAPAGTAPKAPPGTAHDETPPPAAPVETAQAGPPAASGGAPDEASAPVPTSPPAAEIARAGRLVGRVTGDFALVAAVILYGPNSIVREFSRVSPDAGGAFDVPLPPPGRYRIVLSGRGGAQLSYSPPYYQIVVSEAGVARIDFNVTGKIPGSIRN